MTKVAKYRKGSIQPVRTVSTILSIILGFVVSVIVSLVFIMMLSVINLISDTFYIDKYLQYLMVAIHMLSIFIGSVYAAQRSQSKVLIVGMIVGVLYVMFSVGVGMTASGESISLSLLGGKILTGLAAGALGGLVGLNLS